MASAFISSAFAAVLLACPLIGSASPAPLEELDDEVVVEGKSLGQLRTEIVRAEDRFYEKYNRLNRDREYAMQCEDSAATGTKLNSRKCKPRMVETATSQQARDFLHAMQDNFLVQQGEGAPGAAATGDAQSAESAASVAQTTPDIATAFARGGPAESMIAGERSGFRRNMLELIRTHPELQKLIAEHASAMRRYEAARRKSRAGLERAEPEVAPGGQQ